MTDSDVIIIGSGPAGMSAAITAAEQGAIVSVIDEQDDAGGQIYRGLSRNTKQRAQLLGNDYVYGQTLLSQLGHPNIRRIQSATVWSINATGVVTYSQQQAARQLKAKYIVIATGALERPYPIPGWTLPGVMTVGAAQILLKTSHFVINNPILAGTGPLLYAVASQILAAGGNISAIVDTVSTSNFRMAAPHFPFASIRTLATGLGYLRRITKSGVPYYRGATDLSVFGDSEAQGLVFNIDGKEKKVQADTVLLHQGVIPNVQLSRSIGINHQWHTSQRCFHPDTDQWGATSIPTIYIAGDGAGIGGALSAENQGRLTALGILAELNKITPGTRDAMAQKSLRRLKRMHALRIFLDTLYAPPEQCVNPSDSTIICRCEEVTAGEVRKAVTLGGTGPNQVKVFCRSGMGPCQGRYCGNTVTELIAAELRLPQNKVGYYRVRAPIKPVTLQEIANIHHRIEE